MIDRTDDVLLRADEAAERLSFAESTVRQYAHEGKLPSVKIGRALRFWRSDLDSWLETHSKHREATHD